MDDMTAFERQVAGEFVRRAGPVRPVDAAAIFTAITTTQSPKWRFQSMFSATKFVVAGAIVALFGGFLLSGVLTQPSENLAPPAAATATSEATGTVQTTTRSDLLPGVDLVTEEVEPGVFRVVSDGLRELSGLADIEYFPGWSDVSVVAGLDGSVWWLGPDGFSRLGEERIHAWPGDVVSSPAAATTPPDTSTSTPAAQAERPGRPIDVTDIEVGPKGTMWLARPGDDLRSFDGDSWTTRRKRATSGAIGAVEIQQDGTVWAAEKTEEQGTSWRVVRLDADGWEVLAGKIERLSNLDMSVAEDGGGEVWVMAPMQRLQRHDGRRWRVQSVPKTSLRRADLQNPLRAAVAPDGKTLWVRLRSGRELARFDGGEWDVYDTGDGINSGRGAYFEAAPNGSVWFNPINETDIACDGVANLDGDSMRYFLEDQCVYSMDITPDGSVWLQVGEDHGDPGLSTSGVLTVPLHTYVITPEAVAGKE